MTCIFKTKESSLLDQALSTVIVTQVIETCSSNKFDQECSKEQTEELNQHHSADRSSACKWAWNKALFDINSPFLMDTQVERMNREKNGIVAVSAQRKRKRKIKSQLSDLEQKAAQLIGQLLPEITTRAKQQGHLIVSPQCIQDNNKASRLAALVPGPGEYFQELCQDFDEAERWKVENETDLDVSDWVVIKDITDDLELKPSAIIGKLVCHTDSVAKWIIINRMRFLIPQQSGFLTSSYHYFVKQGYLKIKDNSGYDLIVIDPPWKNKSVKRKKSYYTIEESDLKFLPLTELASENCLVCIWVPPNARLMNFVKDELLSTWGVEWLADWIWLKLTQCGEPVYDLNSAGKKTYEFLVIGKLSSLLKEKTCHSSSQETSFIAPEVNQDEPENLIPNDFVFASVPCALHSKKPPLSDILKTYLPKDPRCLELFARNLQPGWRSWGNEPLLHQHRDFYEEVK